MSNYSVAVHPHRHNTNAFVNALLRGLNEFTLKDGVGYSARIPGSISQRPSDMDKRRVRALLDAWNRNIDDMYLDFELVKGLNIVGYDRRGAEESLFGNAAYRTAHGTAINRAFHLLERRALRSVSTELPLDQIVHGARYHPRANYNSMYSVILSWCDDHCYGLANYINNFVASLNGGGGGDSTLPIIYQASCRYIVRSFNAHTGVYSRYFTQRTLMSYLSLF